jgi:hypothetical protein
MGICATLTIFPRNEVRKKKRSPDLQQFELWKEWNELDQALQAMGSPANLALRGNQSESEMEDVDAELFLIPPSLVKKISKALAAISDEVFLETIHENRKKTGWRLRKSEHKDRLAVLETLRDAYRLASKQSAYLEVFIG